MLLVSLLVKLESESKDMSNFLDTSYADIVLIINA